MSQNVREAIISAVKEEQKPLYPIVLASVLAAILSFAILKFGLGFFWENEPASYGLVSALWALSAGLGAFLLFRPHPRIEVRGFWSMHSFSKTVLITLAVVLLQLVTCPHFAFLSHELPGFSFFSHIINFYMSVGGHAFCLFACGLSFSGIAALVSALWIRRTLDSRTISSWLWAAVIILAIILPVGVLQFQSASAHHGGSMLYWILGCFAGVLLVVLFFAVLNSKRIPTAVVPADVQDLEFIYLQSKLGRATNQPSPFFDQGETHLYSDWLMPEVLNTGWDYGDEYYLAGFPDLSELVLRKSDAVQVNQKILEQYQRSGFTKFGALVQKHARDKVFVDLASGRPNASVVPRLVAQVCRSAFYLGVDSALEHSEERKSEFGSPFKSFFISADLFDFVSKLKPASNYFVYVAGLELKEPHQVDAKLRCEELQKALTRSLSSGALWLLGAASHDLQPAEKDFKLIAQSRYHRLYRRR